MYWIIGEKGQLAQALIKECQRKNFLFTTSSKELVDITSATDIKNFVTSYPISTIINTSAFTEVDKAEEESDLAFAVNHGALSNLAQTQKKIVHFSSDYVFDGCSKDPYKETDSTNPLNIYGKSKALGEEALFKESPEALVIRISSLFGEYGQNFVKTMFQLMQERSCIQVVDDQMSKPTYSGDVAEITFKMLNASGVYHFANQEALSWYEFATEILNRLKSVQKDVCCERVEPISSINYPQKAKRPSFSVLCSKKIEKVLSFKIPSYKIGLDKTLLTWTGATRCENLKKGVCL